MRVFYFVFLAVFVAFSSVYAQDDKEKVDTHVTEPNSFKEAYASYQQAVDEKENRKRPSKRYEVTNFNHRITYYAQKAYELGVERYGTEHINSVNLALNWANAYSTHSKGHDYPDKRLGSDFKGFEKALASNPEELINLNMAYGSFLAGQDSQRTKGKSMRYFAKANKIVTNAVPYDEITHALTSLEIGKKLLFNYNILDTAKYLTRARDIFATTPEEHKQNLALANFWLAKSYLTNKKYNSAAKEMSLALKTLDELAPKGHLALAGHAFMVEVLEKLGKREEATKHCQLIGKSQPIDINRDQIPLYRFSPNYPQTNKEGYVTLEFTVDEQGFVKNPKALDGPNMEVFAKAAMKAVVEYRYAPRFEDGKPVSTDGLKTRFTFKKYKR